MGDVLDSEGDPEGALKMFKEGYRIAVQANKIHTQITALENMHYCHMMRFDNDEEARNLQHEIDNLKSLLSSEQVMHSAPEDSSESETEGNDGFSRNRSIASVSSQSSESLLIGKPFSGIEEVEDDEATNSPHGSCKKLRKLVTECEGRRVNRFSRVSEASSKSLSKSLGSPSTDAGRKRARLVLSDDEDDSECTNRRHTDPVEDVATSNEFKARNDLPGVAHDLQDLKPNGYKHDIIFCNPVNLDESSCSHKASTHEAAAVRHHNSSCDNEHCIRMKVEDVPVFIEPDSCTFADELDLEALKVQAACSYYLHLSSQKRSNGFETGLLPIIGQLKSSEQVLASTDLVETIMIHAQAGSWIDASVNGWVQKRLIKLYIDCCQKLSEVPNMKLLMRLYNLEVSEDEVIVSGCELQDMSVVPLLEALHAHKAISMLNLSHNKLGNATMERLQQVFMLSEQKYGALVLDLHCNMFGPTALFLICECPALFSRLEVLNISGNRLTDACGIYLSTVLRNCKALYSLNIERCSITSRTIQVVADALDSGSVLTQLFIGYNHPISGISLANLLQKLATIERFSELSLNGLKLNKSVLDGVCQLARSSCLSGLMLGATNIGCDGALQLTESLFHETHELVKLNLSSCGLTHKYFHRLKTQAPAVCNILELNLAGNPITPEGGNALASLLANPQCSMKVLILNKCNLGLSGVTQIIKSLSDNESLEELNLAENVDLKHNHHSIQNEATENKTSEAVDPTIKRCRIQQAEAKQNDQDALDQLQAADSYDDDDVGAGHTDSGLDDSCTSQGRRNTARLDDQSIEELSIDISNAKVLQLLDLSNNGFSFEAADALYNAWSSTTRSGSPRRHVIKGGQVLHFSMQGKNCCGVKPCCQN